MVPKHRDDDLFFTQYDRERMYDARRFVKHDKRESLAYVMKIFCVDYKRDLKWKETFLEKLTELDLWDDYYEGSHPTHPMYEALYFIKDFAKDYELERRLLAAQMLYAMITWKVQDCPMTELVNVTHILLNDPDIEVKTITIPALPSLIDAVGRYNHDEERVWNLFIKLFDDPDDIVVKVAMATFMFIVYNTKSFKYTNTFTEICNQMVCRMTMLCVTWMYDSKRHRFVSPNTIEEDFNNKGRRFLMIRSGRWFRNKCASSSSQKYNNEMNGFNGIGTWYCRILRKLNPNLPWSVRKVIQDGMKEMHNKLVKDGLLIGDDANRLKVDANGFETNKYGRLFEMGVKHAAHAGQMSKNKKCAKSVMAKTLTRTWTMSDRDDASEDFDYGEWNGHGDDNDDCDECRSTVSLLDDVMHAF